MRDDPETPRLPAAHRARRRGMRRSRRCVRAAAAARCSGRCAHSGGALVPGARDGAPCDARGDVRCRDDDVLPRALRRASLRLHGRVARHPRRRWARSPLARDAVRHPVGCRGLLRRIGVRNPSPGPGDLAQEELGRGRGGGVRKHRRGVDRPLLVFSTAPLGPRPGPWGRALRGGYRGRSFREYVETLGGGERLLHAAPPATAACSTAWTVSWSPPRFSTITGACFSPEPAE